MESVYGDRLREFVFGQPREANSEGGVAPAIFGTVMMTLLMSLAVALLRIYVREMRVRKRKRGSLPPLPAPKIGV